MPSDIVKAITMSSFNSATLNGAYQVLSAELPEACFLVRFINDSDVPVTISYDGISAHDFLLANSAFTLNLQANNRPGNNKSLLKKGTKVYIKGALAGTGYIFLAGYYQP